MIKRILLGIGGTPFTAVAIERAVELAARQHARLRAVTVVDPKRVCKLGPVPPGAGVYAQRMCDNRLEIKQGQIEAFIATLETACREAGVAYDVTTETGNPFELMIAHARYYDLTIFGLRSVFDYRLMETPEDDLIRLLSQGVRPILGVSKTIRTIRRVMVAYSGSTESARAMREFVQSGLWPQAAIEIVHFSNAPDDSQPLLQEAADYCREHGHAVATHVFPEGNGVPILFAAGDLGADMIVMGNSLRSLWVRKVIGDTVLNTLTQAEVPIFLSQ